MSGQALPYRVRRRSGDSDGAWPGNGVALQGAEGDSERGGSPISESVSESERQASGSHCPGLRPQGQRRRRPRSSPCCCALMSCNVPLLHAAGVTVGRGFGWGQLLNLCVSRVSLCLSPCVCVREFAPVRARGVGVGGPIPISPFSYISSGGGPDRACEGSSSCRAALAKVPKGITLSAPGTIVRRIV